MRTRDEIQRAHVILDAIINGSAPDPVREDDEITRNALSAALDVLCWCLKREPDHEPTFEVVLENLVEWLARHDWCIAKVAVTSLPGGGEIWSKCAPESKERPGRVVSRRVSTRPN